MNTLEWSKASRSMPSQAHSKWSKFKGVCSQKRKNRLVPFFLPTYFPLWQYGLSSFQVWDTQLDRFLTKIMYILYFVYKGQKILKAIYGVLNSQKKWTKLTILRIFFTQDSEFCSFLGELRKVYIFWPLEISLSGQTGPNFTFRVNFQW